MTKKEQDAFIESMELGKQQTLFFTADLDVSVQILTGLAGLITLTVGMGVTYFLYGSEEFLLQALTFLPCSALKSQFSPSDL